MEFNRRHPRSSFSRNLSSKCRGCSVTKCLPRIEWDQLLPVLSVRFHALCSSECLDYPNLCTFSHIAHIRTHLSLVHCFSFFFSSRWVPWFSFAQYTLSVSNRNNYLDIADFFCDFLYPIPVFLVSFHAHDIYQVGFPKLVIVVLFRFILFRQLFIAVNTVEFIVSFFIQVFKFW